MSEYSVIQHLKKENYSLIPSIYSYSFEDKPWINDWFKIPQFNIESNWIAYFGEEAIGFVISFISNEFPYISVLAVDPKHQHKGVGKQLIEYTIKYWLNLGYKYIRIHLSFERKTTENTRRWCHAISKYIGS